MEALAQQLQQALTVEGVPVGVWLGSEHLDLQTELPLVVMVPGDVIYGPADGQTRDTLASGTSEVALICKAALYEEAVALAELCYAAIGTGRPGRIRLRSEVWGDYTIRVADLTLTFPTTLTRADITRMRVTRFTQLVQFLPPTPSTPEVPDAGIDGETEFEQSP